MRVDLNQLMFIDKKVRAIAKDIQAYFRIEFEVTSIHRIGDKGVHGTLPCRGLDLGCKDPGVGKAVEDFVEANWVYDPGRPNKVCCRFHKTKRGNYHLHIQTHPNTVRR